MYLYNTANDSYILLLYFYLTLAVIRFFEFTLCLKVYTGCFVVTAFFLDVIQYQEEKEMPWGTLSLIPF